MRNYSPQARREVTAGSSQGSRLAGVAAGSPGALAGCPEGERGAGEHLAPSQLPTRASHSATDEETTCALALTERSITPRRDPSSRLLPGGAAHVWEHGCLPTCT